jgi:Ca2+-binding EF-hand superfamily protein
LRKVFNHFDDDGSGSVNGSELKEILNRLNVKLSDKAFDALMLEIDANGTGQMDFDEFCTVMAPVMTGKFDDEDLYFAFKKFDTDNSGLLNIDELQQVLAKIGQNYSEKQIKDLIRTVNNRNDGTITFDGTFLVFILNQITINKFNTFYFIVLRVQTVDERWQQQ